MGGEDVPENRVTTCDTGHYNMHRLLADLIKTGRMRRGGSANERSYAQTGFAKWNKAGKPGHPVFEEEK